MSRPRRFYNTTRREDRVAYMTARIAGTLTAADRHRVREPITWLERITDQTLRPFRLLRMTGRTLYWRVKYGKAPMGKVETYITTKENH